MTTTNKSKPSLTKIIEKSFDVFQGVKESSGSGNFDKSSSPLNLTSEAPSVAPN
jgi:hypothetical protein